MLNGWSSEDKLIRVQFYLSHDAENWYMGKIEPLKLRAWENFEDQFCETFCRAVDGDPLVELMNMNQRREEAPS